MFFITEPSIFFQKVKLILSTQTQKPPLGLSDVLGLVELAYASSSAEIEIYKDRELAALTDKHSQPSSKEVYKEESSWVKSRG